MTEDEMVGQRHRLYGHEFAYISGIGDGQGGLACCNPWGRKESDTTEQLHFTQHPWEAQRYDIIFQATIDFCDQQI